VLATLFLPVCRRLASRYPASSDAREDLEQVAALGLLKAIDRYQASMGPFMCYAVPTIVGDAGTDRLFGNGGRDLLFRQGEDLVSGGPGRDRIRDPEGQSVLASRSRLESTAASLSW
jgi:Sigma-70 region 2/RTX calcium-binding nonapeptide repeat (4 copies)